jgi:hypothetical protein
LLFAQSFLVLRNFNFLLRNHLKQMSLEMFFLLELRLEIIKKFVVLEESIKLFLAVTF